jgi:hypothetical protein
MKDEEVVGICRFIDQGCAPASCGLALKGRRGGWWWFEALQPDILRRWKTLSTRQASILVKSRRA